MPGETFDISDIKKSDMNKLADAIEEYLEVLLEVMIIPDEILETHGDKINEGIKRSKKLVKRLRKGDKSVFKDEDEWNSLV